MLNTAQIEAAETVKEAATRVAQLEKELAMLAFAQPHLSGIPARHNMLRIADKADDLRVWQALLDVNQRLLQ